MSLIIPAASCERYIYPKGINFKTFKREDKNVLICDKINEILIFILFHLKLYFQINDQEINVNYIMIEET